MSRLCPSLVRRRVRLLHKEPAGILAKKDEHTEEFREDIPAPPEIRATNLEDLVPFSGCRIRGLL